MQQRKLKIELLLQFEKKQENTYSLFRVKTEVRKVFEAGLDRLIYHHMRSFITI